MFGVKAWSKGRTKYNCKILEVSAKKNSNTKKQMFKDGLLDVSGSKNGMWGRPSWRKGKTKENDVKVFLAGRKCSKTKKAQWEALPEEEKQKVRRRWALAGLRCKKKDTSIEIKVREYLNSIGVHYLQNEPVGQFIADFLIPERGLVIECNGDYWHANPKIYCDSKKLTFAQIKNIDRDKRKREYLKCVNIECMTLWESDIHNNFDAVSKKIICGVRNG